MTQLETRDFKRKNYFAIPCFYDSHLHLEGLGKYSQKKNLSLLKSFEDIKAFLTSNSGIFQSCKTDLNLTKTSLKISEAFGLSKALTNDLDQFSHHLKTHRLDHFNLYWVLEDGHQLLVFGDILLRFKTYLKESSKDLEIFQSLLDSSHPIWIFDDSTRNAFDEFYTLPEFKPEESKMQTHFLTAQSILLNAGVTHCRDLTSSLEQIECLDQLYKKQNFHLYLETYFSDFFGDSVSSLIQKSNEAIKFLNDEAKTTHQNLKPSLTKSNQNLEASKLNHKGIKIFLDGTFSQGTADLTCFHNHHDGSGYAHSDRKYKISDIVHFLKQASQSNLEIAFHAMGDGAVEMILKAFDQVKTEFKTKLNLEHCEIINTPTLEYLKALDAKFKDKIVLHFQPSHFLMDQVTLEKLEIEAKGDYHIFAWSQLLRLGYKVHFGSDAPVVKPGLHFLNNSKFNSFLRSKDDYNLFWSSFNHPEYRYAPNTFTLFKTDPNSHLCAVDSVVLDSKKFI